MSPVGCRDARMEGRVLSATPHQLARSLYAVAGRDTYSGGGKRAKKEETHTLGGGKRAKTEVTHTPGGGKRAKKEVTHTPRGGNRAKKTHGMEHAAHIT